MIKKILSLLLVVLVIFGASLVWFLLPDSEPQWLKWLAITLAVIITVMVVVWWSKVRKKKRNEKEHDHQVLLKQDARAIEQMFRKSTKQIRGQGRQKLDSLYSLPWYLVLGGESDAKSSFLLQNGLEPVSERYLNDSETEQYLRFWNNDNTVIIEVGHRIFDSEGIDEALWDVLAKQLLKYRPRQGLNGIVSVIGCDRLMTSDKKERLKIASTYQEAVLAMNTELGLNLPVYTAFSKADSVADFTGFFENFNGCDSDSPLGFTFKCEESRRYDKHEFELQSDALIQSVVGQQIELLRNISDEQSSSVVAWPYQLRIFLERVNELLADIGKENRVRQAVWIRGAYLMSTAQSGNQYDLLTQVVADRTEFNSQGMHEQLPGRRSYFSGRIFSSVVLPEQGIVGVNELRHKGYVAARTLAILSVIAGLCSAGLLLKNNWEADEDWRAEAMTQLRVYASDVERLHSDYSTSDMIAVLSALRGIAAKGIEDKPWYQRISVKQEDTAARIYQTYQEQLGYILLPKLEELIGGELYVYVNLGNPSKIFEVLRYYQMLFDSKRLNIDDMQTYLVENLKDQGEVSADEITALSLLIDDLFHSQYDKLIEPNKELIAVATNNLEGLSPERLIYARIKSMPQYKRQVDVRRQLGEKFDSLFVFSNDFHGYLLPEIFTKQGYANLDLSVKSEILRSQLAEFKAIQGDMSGGSITELTNLSKQVQRLYFSDYIYHWKDLVNNIQVKQFDGSLELGYALRTARAPATSPLIDVLDAVVVNTKLARVRAGDANESKLKAQALGLAQATQVLEKADNLEQSVGQQLLRLQPAYVVNEAFLAFDKYVNGNGRKDSNVPLDGLMAEVDSLNTYYDAALSSSNPAKAFHDYAKAHALGTEDAIVAFRKASSQAPSKVAEWTNTISDQVWKQVVNGGTRYLNTQWDETVYQFYASAIEGRFPFALYGRGEVNLDDFTQFFKFNGLVDRYVDDYLKPFVYWDNGRLKLNEVDGMTLDIDANTLKQLDRAQTIRKVFFGSAGQKLAMTIGLKASSMTTSVTEFKIKEAETLFSYKHGPRVWSDIHWPSTSVDGHLSTEFYRGQNRVAAQSFSGQWAIFRALFTNESSATTSRLIRKLNYKVKDDNIVLDYTLRNSNQALTKGLFVYFALPKKL